ncbi:hypothetical protein [Neptuniibacter sp.]|uniref:hypothetical protein n=1 Tax=Neptuniibacter sp. TaxID=1962643 RepID=UPI003B5BFAFE
MSSIKCALSSAWLLTQLGDDGQGINWSFSIPNFGIVPEHPVKSDKQRRVVSRRLLKKLSHYVFLSF